MYAKLAKPLKTKEPALYFIKIVSVFTAVPRILKYKEISIVYDCIVNLNLYNAIPYLEAGKSDNSEHTLLLEKK